MVMLIVCLNEWKKRISVVVVVMFVGGIEVCSVSVMDGNRIFMFSLDMVVRKIYVGMLVLVFKSIRSL